ncbi:sensor histidine kinase [Shouchella shacheensis]|uniref:sensor histidine kinase n=1 Tax=Shouchella shacheensis TaxID=1649580 RepID=UPI0007401E4B|nr:sensor histidine kinase [Shouchella shacheensis]
MAKKFMSFQTYRGISPYIWAIFFILPFYFIFRSTSTAGTITGLILTILFFIFYRVAFAFRGWYVFPWAILLIGLSTTSITVFSYIYFAFFVAYFIGNIRNRVAFYILYFLQLVSTSVSINYGLIMQDEVLLTQFPFVIVTWISVILLPFSIFNKKEREHLEEKLEVANERISDLVKLEERQRIARDLHDTLGQKLSLIGLKSDLARKLIYKDPEQARVELKGVQQTARTSLNEVRKMVSSMRGTKLKDEVARVKQILEAAEIDFTYEQERPLSNVSLLTENILSMCLKEAVNNVVKHSGASACHLSIVQRLNEVVLTVRDDGIFKATNDDVTVGNGLPGMKERLDFINGNLSIDTTNGTSIRINVYNDLKINPKDDG